MDTFNTLIIDPNPQGRIRLQNACTPVVCFKNFQYVKNLDHGLTKLDLDEPLNIVFLAQVFTLEEVSAFIKAAKTTRQGQSCAFIALRSSIDDDEMKAAQALLAGVDAHLREPYSVDSLTEITLLAARIRKDFERKKVAAAIKMMIGDVVGELRVTAHFLGEEEKHTSERHMKQFREAANVLRSLQPDQKDLYFELLGELLEKEAPPGPLPDSLSYKGPSARLKRRLEQKIIERLKSFTPDQ